MVESQTIEGAGMIVNTAGRRHRRRMTLGERFKRHLDIYVGGQMYITNETFDPFKAKPGDGAYCGTIETIAFDGDILNIHLSWAAKKNRGWGWSPHERLEYSFNWNDYIVEKGKFKEYRLSSRFSGESVKITTKLTPDKVEPPDE